VARLRHPTGQLALLNPGDRSGALTPRVLPFSAIDFDDRAKAQQAVEMAGCLVPYVHEGVDQASLCVAVGNNPLAGGFIYAVGQLGMGELVPRRLGERDLSAAHRLRISVSMRGQTFRWLAPFEASARSPARGRLTGFAEDGQGQTADKPVRDFRGWLWQDERCLDGSDSLDCERRSFFSIRLPVELFRDELQSSRGKLVWPPADLDHIQVRVQVLAPGRGQPPLFDSQQPGATPLFSLQALNALLLPGETLRIRRGQAELALLSGQDDHGAALSPWLDTLIRALPVEDAPAALQASDIIQTPLGRFEITLTGDVRGVQRALGRVATRMLGFVGALLAAIVLTWVAIELQVIRRITVLTRRAAAVSRTVKGQGGAQAVALDVRDLRGSDELGLLAGTLGDLLQRVNEDVRREQIRVAQEKDQWHAVGHEIMSPLQSLMVLHGQVEDPSHRYIQRMQQAIKVLYGQASPAEAFEATTLGLASLDLDEFLQHVAQNAHHAGIQQVVYTALGQPLRVRADPCALEDVVTHVLRNADRYRPAGSAITLQLQQVQDQAVLRIHNAGPAIAAEQLQRIFEYGVSDADPAAADAAGHRGQGLFVARTWMAKMGGTIEALNEDDGVSLVLRLAAAP
jgi:signal transduction histidine kinase